MIEYNLLLPTAQTLAYSVGRLNHNLDQSELEARSDIKNPEVIKQATKRVSATELRISTNDFLIEITKPAIFSPRKAQGLT